MTSPYLRKPIRTEEEVRAVLQQDFIRQNWLECHMTFEDEFRDVPMLDLRKKDYGRAYAVFGLGCLAFIATVIVWLVTV